MESFSGDMGVLVAGSEAWTHLFMSTQTMIQTTRACLRTSVALGVILATIACSGTDTSSSVVTPLYEEFEPGWNIPVPLGTKVLEYPVILPKDRGEARIHLIPDLVIGGDEAAGPNFLFHNPQDIAVDPEGQIYVTEGGSAATVRVYNARGEHVRNLGGRGHGPGEFAFPTAIEIAGGRVIVSDANRRRFVVWSFDGELIDDSRVSNNQQIYVMDGTLDGFLISGYTLWIGESLFVIVRMGLDGRESFQYGALKFWRSPGVSRTVEDRSTVSVFLPVGTPQPFFAAAANGDIYVTPGDEYQILSLTADGQARWALRVEWPRLAVSQEEIDLTLEPHRERFSEQQISRIRWPERAPALSSGRKIMENGRSLRVDGHGHLYVFPHIAASWRSDDRWRPVDVYSRDGDLLLAGMIPNRNWLAAEGEHVYSIENDATTGNARVVRYRLVESFDPMP